MVADAARYADEHGLFTFTSVTVHEIVYGLEIKDAHSQVQKVRHWLDRNETLTPSADDYVLAATIRAKARKHGSQLELPDTLIAAVAVRLGHALVTGNTDDFQAIQRTGVPLTLRNWRHPES